MPEDREVAMVVSSTPRVPSMFRTTRSVCDFKSGKIELKQHQHQHNPLLETLTRREELRGELQVCCRYQVMFLAR